MRLQTSRNIYLQSTNQGGFWKLCLNFFLKMLVSVTSPTNSFVHIHTKKGLMHIYFVTNITAWCRHRLIIRLEKYKLGSCKLYSTKKWWQPQKNHTKKGRIRDFYIFCIDKCNAILITFILALIGYNKYTIFVFPGGHGTSRPMRMNARLMRGKI